MIVRVKASRTLSISKTKTIKESNDLQPDVIILSAWSDRPVEQESWKFIAQTLHVKSIVYVACVGTFAEKLHDEIDEKFYQLQDENQNTRLATFITTHHDKESLSDVVNYCLYATGKASQEDLTLLAILDAGMQMDRKLEKLLLEQWA